MANRNNAGVRCHNSKTRGRHSAEEIVAEVLLALKKQEDNRIWTGSYIKSAMGMRFKPDEWILVNIIIKYRKETFFIGGLTADEKELFETKVPPSIKYDLNEWLGD